MGGDTHAAKRDLTNNPGSHSFPEGLPPFVKGFCFRAPRPDIPNYTINASWENADALLPSAAALDKVLVAYQRHPATGKIPPNVTTRIAVVPVGNLVDNTRQQSVAAPGFFGIFRKKSPRPLVNAQSASNAGDVAFFVSMRGYATAFALGESTEGAGDLTGMRIRLLLILSPEDAVRMYNQVHADPGHILTLVTESFSTSNRPPEESLVVNLGSKIVFLPNDFLGGKLKDCHYVSVKGEDGSSA